ncbi:hypothetical protein QBC47DRAFT_393927 [Echria macrotheca]|uniref:Uncharacterized protein n=1 Tax=Echria macrotheca TaxID=438768 RepID=A0AAJ0B2B8_9PEZI|nr:hypothetical protein QBC47DRAFT_393927 [Echria macrotheca]
MSDPNIFISNGTCYSAPGKKLDPSFIPCGNDAFGHVTCCGAGDNCLVDNACWGVHDGGKPGVYGSSLTYQAGCTDPEYKDPSCPRKEFDQPWIALTLCDHSGGAWAPCSQIGNPTTLQPGAYCSCTDASKTTIAVKDTDPLTSLASLPRSTGESIQFFAGHFPTAPGGQQTTGQGSSPSTGGGSGASSAVTTGTATSGPGSGTGSNTASNTSSSPDKTGGLTSDPTTGSSSGLSTGTKVAIGVGVSVGVLILIAAIIALFILRRRGRGKPPKDDDGSFSTSKTSKGRLSGAIPSPKAPEVDGQPVSEADGKAARPWSMRSELEGSQVPLGNGKQRVANGNYHQDNNLSPVAELPGSNSWGKETRVSNGQRR